MKSALWPGTKNGFRNNLSTDICLQSVPASTTECIELDPFMLLFLDPHVIEFNYGVLEPILSKY